MAALGNLKFSRDSRKSSNEVHHHLSTHSHSIGVLEPSGAHPRRKKARANPGYKKRPPNSNIRTTPDQYLWRTRDSQLLEATSREPTKSLLARKLKVTTKHLRLTMTLFTRTGSDLTPIS